MAAVVVAVTAAASVEAVALTVAGFVVALVAVAFVMVAFAAVGSTIAASTIGSSSLAILGTHSFTIPIHTTAIILMVTDTAALAAVALVAVAFVMVAFAAVGDPYNNLFTKAAPDIDEQKVDPRVHFSKTGE